MLFRISLIIAFGSREEYIIASPSPTFRHGIGHSKLTRPQIHKLFSYCHETK